MTTSPPALSALIDIPAFYQRYVTVSGRTTNSARDGREWHGSCPRCGGTDRFSWWESGRFSCSLRSSGCGWHGSSPYWFLRDEGYSHFQACDELGIDPYEYDPKQTNALPLFMTRDEEPVKKWMDAAQAFVWRAERYLWSPGGKIALEYLKHSRGLSEDVIRLNHLGYCPGWFSESLSSWGLSKEQTGNQEEIKIPPGIILPYFVEGHCWRIQIKRFEYDNSYFEVLGSSNAPFGIDSLEPGKAVLLLEGEFDVLSAIQEASDLVTVIGTGGTDRARIPRWITKLKQAPTVLIGFDQDENNAGDEGARWWLSKLGKDKATRWTPWLHDVNKMLTSGLPIRAWIELGLHSAQTRLAPVPLPEPVVVSPAVPVPPEPQKPRYISHRERNPQALRNTSGDLLMCSFCKKEKATMWRFNAEREQAACTRCSAQWK